MNKQLVTSLILMLGLVLGAQAQHSVPSTLFGSSLNAVSPTATPPVPSAGNVAQPWCPQDGNHNIVPFDSNRLWDDGMKWGQIETSAGSYTWAKFDYAITTLAATAGCPMTVLYQIGDTPSFYATGSPTGPACATPGPTSCAPPNDLNFDGTGADLHFMNFVGQLINRAVNVNGFTGLRIGIWNEADSGNFWCNLTGAICGGPTGSTKNLILMAWDLKNLANCFDPTIKIVSPNSHVATALTWQHIYVTTSINAPARNITIAGHNCTWGAQTVTGKDTFDHLDMHMRGTGSTNPDPAAVITAYNNLVTEATNDGMLSFPFSNNEWGLNPGQAPNLAYNTAFIADNLILQASFGSPVITWGNLYQWDKGNFVQNQTISGTAFGVVQRWFKGATANLYVKTGNIYSVSGTLGSGGGSYKMMFDDSATCTGSTISTCPTTNQSAGSFTSYQTLDGVAHPVISGQVPVGFAAILLTGGGGGTPAAAPTFNPVTGTNFGSAFPQSITISTTAGGVICYTTSGTTPATNGTTGCTTGTKYTAPVSISINTTFKAIAGGTGFTDSTVSTSSYTFNGTSPLASPGGATYVGAQNITLTTFNGTGACYTTNGTTPASDGAGNCTTGTLYTVPISVTTSETLKTISIKNGWLDGSTSTNIYTIQYTLSSVLVGLGSVTSAPTGLSCGSTCSAIFNQGTVVTLTATAGSGYTFAGWSGGGCGGTGTCVVTLNTTTSVTATFSINSSTANRMGVMLQ